jgi:hypothetical protein
MRGSSVALLGNEAYFWLRHGWCRMGRANYIHACAV